MANCPDCKTSIPDSAKNCPHCGARVIEGSTLERIATVTTTWQKIVIIVGLVALIAIGFTFQNAGNREDKAAQSVFTQPVSDIISAAAMHTGLGKTYGMPGHTLQADTKTAEISLQFPRGPLNARQAQIFANTVCGLVARTYVDRGYIPRQVTVSVSSATQNGKLITYGKSVYNGNLDSMHWEAEAQ